MMFRLILPKELPVINFNGKVVDALERASTQNEGTFIPYVEDAFITLVKYS